MTGKDITVILSQNGTAMAATRVKSDSIRTNAETIEKASATQQIWREFLAGRAEWSLSIDYLVLESAQIRNLLRVRQIFDVTIMAADGIGTETMTGRAIMTAADINSVVNSLAKGSFTLKGTGPLV